MNDRALQSDLKIDIDQLDWVELIEGIFFKMLKYSEETGAFSIMLRVTQGTTIPRHRHLGPAEYLMVSGHMDYRNGSAPGGFWGLEPNGAIHESTTFPEETVMFYRAEGPTVWLDSEDQVAAIYDGQAYLNAWEAAQHQ